VTPGRRSELGTYIYAGVAVAVLFGLVLVAIGGWRAGTIVAGGAMITAGIARGALPERIAGLLRIRRRSSDVLLMLAFGTVLIALGVMIPNQP
jgi:ABC-type uncharacterized transport system permease subunit